MAEKPKDAPSQQMMRQEAAQRSSPAELVATKESAATKQTQKSPLQEATLPSTPVLREEPIKQAPIRPEKILLKKIYFDFDKYNLTPEAREILREHAQILMKLQDFSLVIEGHCDERGSNEYNLALGERRAVEAMRYLVALGVNEKKIKTVSYGEELPAEPGSNEEAWAKNRRAEFDLTIK